MGNYSRYKSSQAPTRTMRKKDITLDIALASIGVAESQRTIKYFITMKSIMILIATSLHLFSLGYTR